VTVLALLATFVVTTSFAFGSQLVVLEDQTAEPAVLDTMHDDMISSGFVLLRPLQGRLAGQGYLWAVPATVSVQEATSLVSEMDGCLQAIDAATGTFEIEQINGYEVIPGKLYIWLDADADTKQDAMEQLGSLGFVLFWESHYFELSQWTFLPLEYSVQEAIAEVEAVGGVMHVSEYPIIRGYIGPDPDANGDGRVNILDMILVRNRLNQDPFSGDNWKADVNRDGRINILDLFYVRNRLSP